MIEEITTAARLPNLTMDAHGDVVGLCDEAGVPGITFEYEAYGKKKGGDIKDGQGYVGAQGVYEDWSVGLQYMQNRWYDPELGRFLSRDPAGLKGGLNLYSYCGNDPVGATDAEGLYTKIALFPSLSCGGFYNHGHVGIAAGPSVNASSQTRGYCGGRENLSLWSTGFVKEDEMGKQANYVILPTTAEQESAIESHFNQLAKNPGTFSFPVNNCATQVLQSLLNAGLDLPGNLTPRGLFDSLKELEKQMLEDLNKPKNNAPTPVPSNQLLK